METVTLWRPTGPEELALVEASGWKRWPPRFPDQPIFYPVLNEWYATKIASEWNVKASGVGHVTRFEVRKDFLDAFDVQQVGGRDVLEYWIPAGELEAMNNAIVGFIELVATYPEHLPVASQDAQRQSDTGGVTGSKDDDQASQTILGGRTRPPRWHPEHVSEAQTLGISPNHPEMYRDDDPPTAGVREPVGRSPLPGKGQHAQEES